MVTHIHLMSNNCHHRTNNWYCTKYVHVRWGQLMESFSILCSKRRGASIVDIKNTDGASSIQNQVFIRIKIKWCVVFVVIWFYGLSHHPPAKISIKTALPPLHKKSPTMLSPLCRRRNVRQTR